MKKTITKSDILYKMFQLQAKKTIEGENRAIEFCRAYSIETGVPYHRIKKYMETYTGSPEKFPGWVQKMERKRLMKRRAAANTVTIYEKHK